MDRKRLNTWYGLIYIVPFPNFIGYLVNILVELMSIYNPLSRIKQEFATNTKVILGTQDHAQKCQKEHVPEHN